MCTAMLLAGGATGLAAAAPKLTVVELFTSQGCSSCPPADELLRELAARPGILALSLHVDYWDGLGWRDPFGIAGATPRQRTYASALHLDSIFTPQMVIDGTVSVVGSDRHRIERQLQQRSSAATRGPAPALEVATGVIQVHVPAQAMVPSADVFLVAYRRSALSEIGRGENAGRTLEEFNIVRELRPLGRYTGGMLEFRVAAKSLPSDATDVAVVIQETGQGAVLSAARASL